MEENKYIEKLLETKFQGMEKYLKISFKNVEDKLLVINTKQDKTNGNVIDLQRYKWKMTGVASVIIAVLLPIAFIVISSLFN